MANGAFLKPVAPAARKWLIRRGRQTLLLTCRKQMFLEH